MFKIFNVIYNNKIDSDFGIYAIKRPNIPCPEKEKEDVSIKGADETLTRWKNEGYKNITISVEYNFKDTEDFDFKCRKIKNWFLGTVTDRKLRFSYDNDVFYIVKNVKLGDIERQWKVLGKFTVQFECSPYAWLNNGLKKVNIPKNNGRFYNSFLRCKPEWHFKGNGTVDLNVNGKLVVIKVGESVIINTELQKCYKDNKVVSLSIESGSYNDLWLREGENDINWSVKSGDIKSVTIIPHYKTL